MVVGVRDGRPVRVMPVSSEAADYGDGCGKLKPGTSTGQSPPSVGLRDPWMYRTVTSITCQSPVIQRDAVAAPLIWRTTLRRTINFLR